MKELLHPRRTPHQMLREMSDCGFCADVQERDTTLFTMQCHGPWSRFARECSTRFNGLWHAKPKGLRWQNGQQNFYFLDEGDYSNLANARHLVYNTVGKLPTWTFGSCARHLIAWSLIPVDRSENDSAFFQEAGIGYRECTPGAWNWGVNFDCNGCYYQLITRLKSPRLGINDTGQVEFFPLFPDERAKWNEVLRNVADLKTLRNSMWGCMLGATRKKYHYFNGEKRVTHHWEGSHYATAALVARSAWELCQQAAIQTNAVCAHTDNVIVIDGSEPQYWRDFQLKHSVRLRGKTIVQHTSGWTCGGKATKYYDGRHPFVDFTPRPPIPERLFHVEWLMTPFDRLLTKGGIYGN